jgi:hypothetical protein
MIPFLHEIPKRIWDEIIMHTHEKKHKSLSLYAHKSWIWVYSLHCTENWKFSHRGRSKISSSNQCCVQTTLRNVVSNTAYHIGFAT